MLNKLSMYIWLPNNIIHWDLRAFFLIGTFYLVNKHKQYIQAELDVSTGKAMVPFELATL